MITLDFVWIPKVHSTSHHNSLFLTRRIAYQTQPNPTSSNVCDGLTPPDKLSSIASVVVVQTMIPTNITSINMTRKVKPGSTPPHLVDATGTLSANRRLKMSPVDRAKIIEEHDSVFQMLLDNVESPHDVEEKIRIKEYGTCRSMVATAQRPSRIRRVVIIIMLISMAIIALVVPIAVVFGRHTSSPPPAASWAAGTWNASNFKNLVTFGDSYTDEARGLYYQGHNGQFPPPGWIAPVVSWEMLNSRSGGAYKSSSQVRLLLVVMSGQDG